MTHKEKNRIQATQTIKKICEYMNLPYEDIINGERYKQASLGRIICTGVVSRTNPFISATLLAEIMGKRAPSVGMTWKVKFDGYYKVDKTFKEQIDAVEWKLRNEKPSVSRH